MRMIRPGRGTVQPGDGRGALRRRARGSARPQRACPAVAHRDGRRVRRRTGGAGRGRSTGSSARRCHGDALEGSVGPPLAGDGFLSVWSALPVVELVDKIHNTMPLQAAAPLSRRRVHRPHRLHPRGRRAFRPERRSWPTPRWPTSRSPRWRPLPRPPAAGTSPVAPIANLAQLMRAIAFPASNIVFNTQIKDPGADVPEPTGTRPFDFVEWGETVYPGWESIDLAALAIAESAPLFLVPGRRCEKRPAGARGPGRLAGVHCGGRRGGAGRLPGVAVARLGRRHRGHRPAQRGVRELPRGLSRRGRRGARGGCGPLPAGPLTGGFQSGGNDRASAARNPAERTRGYG